ncbi:hypothetical protein [Eubacterium sp. An3]|uniref:hypothetical protein n=1 Tax=Eubacterium sp. An3 TaxID=1965628 RepID=UPI000B3741AE|nr:hypothetical protein [Eubacterium sp. An3]OUO25993.1 hypothetical protein B5F87_15635 [Eubacterium sp. An3]
MDNIITGIIGLLGVLVGGFLNYFITVALDYKKGNEEAKILTICEYEKLCDQLRKYNTDRISHDDLMNYYYNHYSERKAEIKAKQLMYFSKKQRKIVDDIDNHVWKMLEDENILQLFKQLQSVMEKLK